MKVVIDFVKIEVDPKNTIQNIKAKINEQMLVGFELKSHVIDGMGNLFLTFQKSKPENQYSYHLESIDVDIDPAVTKARLDEVNERLERINYVQKSMFLDGQGHYILTYLINTKKNGNKVQRAKNQSNRGPRQPR
jgi:hypothetical protein